MDLDRNWVQNPKYSSYLWRQDRLNRGLSSGIDTKGKQH
jgi:hypothetical protein